MAQNYAIVVDSTTDITSQLATDWNVEIIPYIFTLDGKDYYNHLDYRELSVKDFYNKLREGKMATTTQVTAHRYREAWEPFLKDGKDILYMCLSSALSKSYDQSCIAANELREEYPDRKIITIDTKAASLGQGLLAYLSSKARAEGKSVQENADYIESIIPRLNHWIVPDDLHHLHRGGRLSGMSAFIGSMLSIKPVLAIIKDGSLAPVTKARGWAKALDFILGKMEELEYTAEDLFIAHSDHSERAEQTKQAVSTKFGDKNFVINSIGPVIGTHTGPGTIALVFIAKERVSV